MLSRIESKDGVFSRHSINFSPVLYLSLATAIFDMHGCRPTPKLGEQHVNIVSAVSIELNDWFQTGFVWVGMSGSVIILLVVVLGIH
jgi:hypothetical protein